MRTIRTWAACAAVGALLAAGTARAEVVTFDDAAGQAAAGMGTTPFSDQGLRFAYSDGFGSVLAAQHADEGNGTLNYVYGLGPGVTITRDRGGVFDLASIDLTLSWYTEAGGGPYDPAVTLPSDTVTLTAQTAAGPDVLVLEVDQGFLTYGVNLTGITSLTISGISTGGNGYFAMDNLTGRFNDVPEPAAWALMIAGFGLAGAALRGRRVVIA